LKRTNLELGAKHDTSEYHLGLLKGYVWGIFAVSTVHLRLLESLQDIELNSSSQDQEQEAQPGQVSMCKNQAMLE
jgi:hypothetical protein